MLRPCLVGLCAAALSLAACDPSPPASTGGSAGAGATGGSSMSGGAGGAPPSHLCQGKAIPESDLDISKDGLSTVVSCSGQTLLVSVLDPAIVRLGYDLPKVTRPSYAALPQPAPKAPVIGGTADTAVICTDELYVEVGRADCRARVTDRLGNVLLEPLEGAQGMTIEEGERTATWAAMPDEHFYGFGEKTGALDKRGRTLKFHNEDAYDSTYGGFPPGADPLYASIPFFVGLRGGVAYGVFVDNSHALTFNMATPVTTTWSVRAPAGSLDHYVLAGPKVADVVERFTRLTGRTPLPPRWTLGYHQSRWGYSPDAKVIEVADELRARKIPADAMWLDIQHMRGYRSFTWDPVTFPDPAGMVQSLADKGFRTVAIVDPGIKADPAWDVYTTGVEKGYFLLFQDGNPYVGTVWPGDAVFPDFSAPEVRSYWASLVPGTLDAGVRGLWIDMNEPADFLGPQGSVPDDLPCAGDGVPTTMAEMHNVYALNEARATYEGMKMAAPDERPFVLTRAGYAGVQRYAAIWTGDSPSAWGTLRETLPELLGLGLSGVTFSGSDVGGFAGTATPEMFARWVQLGSFSPFFRGHAVFNMNNQEPWQFGIEVTDISRAVIEERYRRMPYLYSLFREASASGAPVLRPLVYEAQDDPATYEIDDEAMLGPFLLYAPVLTEGATKRTVYLPKGRWFEAASGAIHEGPVTFDVDVVLGALPTFLREGAIVPERELVQSTDEKPIGTLTLDVYPSEQASSFALYEDDGHSFAFEKGAYAITRYALQRSATGATLSAGAREGTYSPPARAMVVRVRRVDHAPTSVTLSGAPLPEIADYSSFEAAQKGYFYDARDLSILVRFPDPGALELSLDYDPAITEAAPDVLMDFEVTVPPGTPQDPPIHLSSSANGWAQAPLQWVAPDRAAGTMSVPRGAYFFYKYTRGDWATVEKWPGCVEATDRYELGKAHPTKQDTVWAWADMCP